MKMSKKPLNFDERETNIFRKICTVMYILTLYSLIGIQLYRQFVLHQPQEQWNDIAMLLTVNVIVFLGSILYISGVVNPRQIKLSHLLVGFGSFVLIGFLFTIFKYAVLLKQDLSLAQLGDNLLIVIAISGILALGWGLFAYLGSRRIEKQIE
jgi:predicted permease